MMDAEQAPRALVWPESWGGGEHSPTCCREGREGLPGKDESS